MLDVDITGKAGTFGIEAAFRAGDGVTALFGASGSGKTSLLRMIAGTLRPDAGRIAVNGRTLFDSASNIDLPASRRGIGYVFQDGRLFPHLSVHRNLDYARWAGRRKPSRPFDEVVALLGLESQLARAPATLSGGERQRVAIGRALLADPSILLMDEPLASLDQARRQDILPYLEQIRDRAGIPIVYVSHEVSEVARLADTLVVLSAGRIVAAGRAAEVFARLDLPGLFAGALLEGEVSDVDIAYGTASVAVEGHSVELVHPGLTVGQKVRLGVLSRDVALARIRPDAVSVRNILPCQVVSVQSNGGPHADVSLTLGAQRLNARITRKSAEELALTQGDAIFALLKAVTIERGTLHSEVTAEMTQR